MDFSSKKPLNNLSTSEYIRTVLSKLYPKLSYKALLRIARLHGY
jgi:hypothetical protein